MNSKKMWHSFGMIVCYLLFTAIFANVAALISKNLNIKWGFPFAFGIILWIVSLILLIKNIDNRSEFSFFLLLSFFCNVFSAGCLIGAFIVGKNLSFPFPVLILVAFLISLFYLVLMIFLTFPNIKEKLWFLIIAYILFLTASIFGSIALTPLLLIAYHLPTAPHLDMFLLFFLLLFGFLSLGSLIFAYDFGELTQNLLIPAFIATFLIAIIVLVCLSGGDGCDCDGGCCEGCDCGDGYSRRKYNAASYGKRKRY